MKQKRLLIMSDLHLEFPGAWEYPRIDRDLLLLAGDIHIGTKAQDMILDQLRYSNVVYICGNHEFYHGDFKAVHVDWITVANDINQQASDLGYKFNMYYLNDSIAEFDGYRILGSTLWTDMQNEDQYVIANAYGSMNDYRAIRHGPNKLTPYHTINAHRTAVKFLKTALNDSYSGKTIIMTHHAPSLRSIHSTYHNNSLNGAYATDLEYIMTDQKQKPILWCHGHTHHSFDYIVDATNTICNPRGYADRFAKIHKNQDVSSENTEFSKEMIVTIDI